MKFFKGFLFVAVFILLGYFAYIDKPWLQWGFWDFFWLVLLIGTVLAAFLVALVNDAKKKKSGSDLETA
jgi:hypothetical protein